MWAEIFHVLSGFGSLDWVQNSHDSTIVPYCSNLGKKFKFLNDFDEQFKAHSLYITCFKRGLKSILSRYRNTLVKLEKEVIEHLANGLHVTLSFLIPELQEVINIL